MRSKTPPPTSADVYGYWPGHAPIRRHRDLRGPLVLTALVIGASLVVVANRPGVQTPVKLPPQTPPRTQSLASPEAPFVDRNQLTLVGNNRAVAINAAAETFSKSTKTMDGERQEFVAIGVADATFRDRLAVASFPPAARADLRALLASAERLITSDSLVASAPSPAAVQDAYKQYLDADASEKAAYALAQWKQQPQGRSGKRVATTIRRDDCGATRSPA